MAYSIEQLEKAMNDQASTRKDFIQNLITIGAALLAILASLSTGDNNSRIVHTFYILVVVSISLGILCGGIALYFDVRATKVVYLKLKEVILRQLRGQEIEEMPFYNPPALFYIVEKVCYLSFLVALPCLTIYALMKIF